RSRGARTGQDCARGGKPRRETGRRLSPAGTGARSGNGRKTDARARIENRRTGDAVGNLPRAEALAPAAGGPPQFPSRFSSSFSEAPDGRPARRLPLPAFTHLFFVCCNRREPGNARGCCDPDGSEALRSAFKAELKKRRLGPCVRANR